MLPHLGYGVENIFQLSMPNNLSKHILNRINGNRRSGTAIGRCTCPLIYFKQIISAQKHTGNSNEPRCYNSDGVNTKLAKYKVSGPATDPVSKRLGR
jgi:hypothetical protein